MHGIKTEDYRSPAPCIKNENRDITAMRNIFKSNGKAEQFYKENTLEETNGIGIVCHIIQHL